MKQRKSVNILDRNWGSLFNKRTCESLNCSGSMRTRMLNAITYALREDGLVSETVTVREFLENTRYVASAPSGQELRICQKKVPNIGRKGQEFLLMILKRRKLEMAG